MKKASLTIVSLLFIDQVSKFLVKLNMHLGESIHVMGDLFRIHFIENPGMAFGMEFGGESGKLILNILRIAAVIFLFILLRRATLKGAYPGFLIALSMIIAGALGNILDSAFYGMIFSESQPCFGYENNACETAAFLPNEGYAGFMQGKVVDMLYFPLIQGQFPDWFPFWAGEEFIFFRPVFNIADSSITLGIVWIILKQKKYLSDKGKRMSFRTKDESEEEMKAEEEGKQDEKE